MPDSTSSFARKAIANHNKVQQRGRTMKPFILAELLAFARPTFAAKTAAPLVVLPAVARQLDSLVSAYLPRRFSRPILRSLDAILGISPKFAIAPPELLRRAENSSCHL